MGISSLDLVFLTRLIAFHSLTRSSFFPDWISVNLNRSGFAGG
ncbi:hypothetical protein U716_05580 [Rhodobacter capsulatus B6]|nr:hypothetical protein U716_05580 [Rhodobacter capsulatus B6]